jgi:hypothetical protein
MAESVAAGPRLPARPGNQGHGPLPKGRRRPACLREWRTRSRRRWSLGCRLRLGKVAAGALRVLRAGGEAVLHRGQGSCRPVLGHRKPVRRSPAARPGAGLARGRALLPHREPSRRTRRAVLPRSLRARDEARRRLDGRSDRPPPHQPAVAATAAATPSRSRSPTSTATSRDRSARGTDSRDRQSSPTTKSARCSTKPAMACTTC